MIEPPATSGVQSSLTPPGFKFQPQGDETLRADSYSLFFKVLAAAMALGALLWLLKLLLGPQSLWTGHGVLGAWFTAGTAVLVYTCWHIIRGQTSLDAHSIVQTWIWQKKVTVRELAYAKMIRVRGLEWVIAPRLYVRTLDGKLAAFHAADPKMISEMERLCRELEAFRRA